jgi:hypothetical protein
LPNPAKPISLNLPFLSRRFSAPYGLLQQLKGKLELLMW